MTGTRNRGSAQAALDPRLNAFRDDLADERLRGKVATARYAEGLAAQITSGLAAVRSAPQAAAPIATFFHYGEAVRVFDDADGCAWCQSRRDGYVGYVPSTALAYGAPAPTTHFIATLGAYRYAEPDLRSAAIDLLPRHSSLTVTETGLIARGTEYARLDRGGFIPVGCLSAELPRSLDLAAAAALYLGCPYLWGGRSLLGLDCSGLVQEAFRDLGRAVPRDTDMQQTTIGRAAAIAELADFRRNDLIFIPGHVMICAGKGEVIHAYGGSMSVRRDNLVALMRTQGWALADFTVRRPR